MFFSFVRKSKLKGYLKLIFIINILSLIILYAINKNNMLWYKNDLTDQLSKNLANKYITYELYEESTRKFKLESSYKFKEHTAIELDTDIKIVLEDIHDNVSFKQRNKNLQHRLVHFDLKGAPPKIDYLKSILPLLKTTGATGLLIEYEDMFPYEYNLEEIKAENAYTKKELQDFLKLALILDLDVIPLVQTFGHLEFLLKLESFRELREVDEHPDTICPSKNRSFAIIKGMIDQIIDFHNEIISLKWIHIGCDEVYHINQCKECVVKNRNIRQTFVDHITRVAQYIKTKNSLLVPLIWDDMLRSFLPSELENVNLVQLVQPVVWVYGSSITTLVPHKTWYMYTKFFNGVWIASAFKGAFGVTKLLPPLKKHYDNNLLWLNFSNGYILPGSIHKYNFQGIVLTGWSRYHHFSVLCELLPVSLPSLLLNMILINIYLFKNLRKPFEIQYEKDIFQKWTLLLNCNYKNLEMSKKNSLHLDKVEKMIYYCKFRGNKLYMDMLDLIEMESSAIGFHIKNFFKNDGFLQYNIKHRTMIYYHNSERIKKAHKSWNDIKVIEDKLRKHMSVFYHKPSIEEFIEYKVKPIQYTFERIINASQIINNTKTWKKRPLM